MVTFIRHEKRRSDRKYYYNTSNYVNYVPSKAITIDGLLEELHTTDETVGSSSVIMTRTGKLFIQCIIDEFYYPCDPRNGHYGERDGNGNLTTQLKRKRGQIFGNNL